jgi:hypothetical protein
MLGINNSGVSPAITGATIDGGAGGGPQTAVVNYDKEDATSGAWTAQLSAVVATGTTGATIAITMNSAATAQ